MEKLIIFLDDPKKETPIRAAWLWGQLKNARAVPSLIDLVEKTDDAYIVRAEPRKPNNSWARSPSTTPRWSEMKWSVYYPGEPRPPIL